MLGIIASSWWVNPLQFAKNEETLLLRSHMYSACVFFNVELENLKIFITFKYSTRNLYWMETLGTLASVLLAFASVP